MRLAVYSLIFILSSLMFYIVLRMIFFNKQLVGERMSSISSMYALFEDDDEMKKPFAERVINPAYQSILRALRNITPAALEKKYEKILLQAGEDKNLTPSNLIAIQVMFSLVLSGTLFFSFRLFGVEANIIYILLLGVLTFFVPYVILNSKATKRQGQVQKILPDLLDLLYISVEAGLGFDMALRKAAQKMPGLLSDEITKAMDDIAKGKDRQDALRGIVKRIGLDDLNTFITAVIQAEKLGTNIASILRIQSIVMRQKRRQRAEEKAMKIPVKMLFPLVFFLFPALFVVILGPALINIIEAFSSLN